MVREEDETATQLFIIGTPSTVYQAKKLQTKISLIEKCTGVIGRCAAPLSNRNR